MQLKEMNDLDLKLHLLNAMPINVENLEVKPYTLEEITEYGYTKYMRNLQWILLSVEDFINSIDEDEKRIELEKVKENLKPFDFYIRLGGVDFQNILIEGLKMILKTEDVRVYDDGVIAIGFFEKGIFYEVDGNLKVNFEILDQLTEDEIMIVHRDNYEDLVEVIMYQNYLKKPTVKAEKESNPEDEETRKLIEHMEKMREKVENKKKMQNKKDSDETDITDIISAISSKSGSINKLNVKLLTIYQIYDEYARLELIDNYDFSIKAILAGAEKIEIKHWSARI